MKYQWSLSRIAPFVISVQMKTLICTFVNLERKMASSSSSIAKMMKELHIPESDPVIYLLFKLDVSFFWF